MSMLKNVILKPLNRSRPGKVGKFHPLLTELKYDHRYFSFFKYSCTRYQKYASLLIACADTTG